MLAVGRYFVLVGLFKRGSGGFLKSRGSGVLCKNSTIKLAILCTICPIRDYIAQNSVYSAFLDKLTARLLSPTT